LVGFGGVGEAHVGRGTKAAAQFSGNIHAATVHTYKDQRIDKDNIAWLTRLALSAETGYDAC